MVNSVVSPVSSHCFLDFSDQLTEIMHSRARRRFKRGLKRKPMALVKKLRKAKTETVPGEKPEVVKTHLRNMIIVPEMIGSIVGVYNGKIFTQVEIKVSYSVDTLTYSIRSGLFSSGRFSLFRIVQFLMKES